MCLWFYVAAITSVFTIALYLQTWQHLSLECKAFLSRLLCVDPEERMTEVEALEHPWTVTNLRYGGMGGYNDNVEP